MEIRQQGILDVLGTPNARFVIPVFQRVYSWGERQCEELMDDIERAAQEGNPHFMGLLLFSYDPDSWHDNAQLDVIDGQQRLTTLMLALVALRSYLTEHEEMAADENLPTPDELSQTYLAAYANDRAESKLMLSAADRETLSALVRGDDQPEEIARRIVDNCLFFMHRMDDPSFDAVRFWQGVKLLEVASVLLTAEDSPQLVFESLNSKGMPLSIADRIRNLIIASTTGDEQEQLYSGLWVPLEELCASAEEPTTVTDVVYAWLAQDYNSQHLFDKSEAYGVFKTCLRTKYDGSLSALLPDVTTFCKRYCSDSDFRAETAEVAGKWIAGKPQKLISELKMFGD